MPEPRQPLAAGDLQEKQLANAIGYAMTKNRIKSPSCEGPIDQPRDAVAFAASLRMARAALGWSQVELGRLLGMTQRSVHRIKQGDCEPRRTTLLAIESLLRHAGLHVELRSDGSLCIVVPASALSHRIAGETAPIELTGSTLPRQPIDMNELALREERAESHASIPV